MRNATIILAVAAVLVLGGVAHAGLVVADFNDLSTGALKDQAGGTGFTGNWFGSSGGTSVYGGDLASAKYSITQSGTAQHAGGNHNSPGACTRDLATAMTGEIWFSFLAKNTTTNSRTGIGLNNDDAGWDLNDPCIIFKNDDLLVNLTGSFVTIDNQVTLNQAFLVVGQMIINGGGADDTMKIWVDPDLVSDPDINNHTAAFNSSTSNFADSLTRISPHAYGTGTPDDGDQVDAVRFSDTDTAFEDVTGVPEPATMALLGIGGLGVLIRRRRK